MAVINCEELSNIISLGIVSWDEDLANEISRLSAKKREALVSAWKIKEEEWIDALTWLSAHELELKANSADIEMRAIVQAKVLSGDVRVADAYRELALQIKQTWWTIAWWVDLLEKLRKASPADFEDIAKQWGGEYSKDPTKAIEEMNKAISETISANYSIRQYSDFKSKWLANLKKQLRNKEISQWIFEEEVAKLHKQAMEQIAKWENPKDYVKLDPEWAAIKKIFGDDPISAGKAWSQFIMARELLADGAVDDWILKAFADMGAENLTWELTYDQLAKYWEWDLDKLLARAYTNTEQLYRDGALREAYREKLIELTSWKRISNEDIKKARSIMNTMEFAEEWATFSNVVTSDNALRSARKRWLKVSDWTQVLNWVKAFSKKLREDPKILEKPIKIAWAEMQPLDVIQIIYDITWDENILKLLRVGFFSDGTVLSVATASLLWWNKEASDVILKLFSKAKETAKVSSTRDVTLKAICWDEIKEWAPIWFYDFRKSLYQKDELNRSKADFMDKSAERNKMKVDSTDIKAIAENDDPKTLAETLKEYKWWYIIVNDARWKDNSTLNKALDIANEWLKDEDKITVLFPRWWMTSSFTMEWNQLFFKTIDDSIFREISWTISIQTLWEARPTREILATAMEASTWKNADKLRYQASYSKGAVDNQGRAISDQQYEYFENSMARDENWSLITFYHWTNATKFTTFDINAARRQSNIQWMFFSEREDDAKWYWENIYECYLNITNPASADAAYNVFNKFKWQTNAWVLAREELQKMGYDWVQSYQWEWIVFSPEQIKYVDNRLPTTSRDIRFQERARQYASQADVSPDDAMKVQLFTKDRTWKQIADAYWFDVRIVEWDMIEWVKAYWAYWNWLIYFSDMVKESTAPHELFHAIFDMVWKEQHDKIVGDAMKLFWYSAETAEEVLADAFAEWFKTWKLKYWEVTKKWQKTFLQKVKQFFNDIAEWLWLLDEHRNEVEQMFNDMVNIKYLPDAWKSVNATEAMIKYNDELNGAAAKYFGEMMWLDTPNVISPEYIERVETLLSERLWIDLKAFDQIQDKSALWQRVNQQFTIERLTTWRFDKQIVDINTIKNEISALTEDELEKAIKDDLWDDLIRWTIKWNDNIEHIREAYLDYKTAKTAIDSLTSKWKIVSLANGWTAVTMSMDEIRRMFQEWTFEQVYKQMFLSDQKLSSKDMARFVSAINNNIFDTLSITFADNLVGAWYALPLINIKEFVYDYLRGNLDLNNKFVESFLYKNNIPFTQDWLKTLVDTLMPTNFKFDYEDGLFRWRFGELEQWNASVFVESPNRFLQDSYSTIASIEMAKAWDMPINHEKDILQWILDKYVEEVYNWVKKWTLTFQEAQQLKQEAWYALDMFEQDFLIPRYGKFLSKQEMQWLLWMKYSLPIWVKWQNPDKVFNELNSIRAKIINKYDSVLWNAAQNNDINMSILKWLKSDDERMQKRIDERRQQLIDNGWVIREINWQYLVYNIKQALADTIDNLPDNIGWLEWIKALWRAWIEGLSNKQAYALLRYLEAAKWLSTTANYVTELLYKQNPKLLECNFFETYRVWDTWLPRALEWNILNVDKFLSKFDNISSLDDVAKKNIFDKIVNKFRSQGYVTAEDLDKIIDKWISEAQSTWKQIQLSPKDVKEATDRMKLVYKRVFNPYIYVRDIPKWWTLIDWKTVVRNIKQKVSDAMKLQYKQALDDLKAAWITDVDNIQTAIYIQLDDGSKISLQDAWVMNIDSWKKNVFNDESVFVAWADEIKSFTWSPDDKALLAKQKEWRNEIISQYDSSLQAMLNQTEYISKAEADLTTSFMNDVRTTMRKYTLTNKFVDALDALSWLNEEAARWIKDYLIWWKWNVSFWKWKPWQIEERLWLVKEAYAKYYAMDITKLNSVIPNTRAEDLALRLSKYFKNLERLLWSTDWLTWVTTSAQLNRAFYHIWEIVMSVDTVKWVFWLLSWVEQNQVLKFFKFAKWDLAKDADVFIRRGKWNFTESLWWYRDYAEDISWITRDEFNEIFASNFSEWDFKRILQWLTWFSLTWAWWRKAQTILNFLNWSNFVMRFLMSYPWQLLTIPQQSLAYFLKQIWFEKELWVESLSDVDAIRTHYWILDWAYNEIVLRWKSTVSPDDLNIDSFYNRYWLPDVDEIYKTSRIETSDDYINMYAKIDNHAASSISATNKWFRQLDPYKDNANNIIDGLFARNFKNISFLKAIRNNDFMHFASAREFMAFMNDPTISATIKTRLMDRVTAYSWRNFRNILWLWFWWIDRAVAWSWFWNIMYWLMQLFNFRWSWWQNIFKQTWAVINTALKMLGTSRWVWSREWREAIAEYIAKQPEFTNFVWALFNDLRWTWKLQRFQDNWRWPEDEDVYGVMDFIEYMTETLNMTSQWYQWLQSFWPLRPFQEAAWSIFASHMDPTVYKDTYWVWAFFNALGKNFGRQWKPYNWIAKMIAAWTTDWPDWMWTYVQNEFWKLSFWSLRYMVNEDTNAYGYTYEMSWQTWWIPSILMGESPLGSDKNFSYEIDNTETWETIKQVFNSDNPWETRWTYAWNLGKSLVNWSQLLSLPKNIKKAIDRDAPSYYSADDLAEYMQKTDAWLEFYRRWIVTPKTPEEAEIFFDTMLENSKFRPWSSNFTKSLIQYEDYGHMNGKETWNEADAEMELWLDHIKHLTNEHWEFETSWWEKIIDPSWTKLIEDVRLHWQDETYTTALIYNYAKWWLNNHSSDPNYQLYVKMLWQWQAHNLIEYQTSQILEVLNKGKKWVDNKWTKTEFENVWFDKALLLQLWNSVLEWDDRTFFDRLQVLDEDDATVAALQIIQKQANASDRKVLDRFFDVTENDDWSKSVKLKYSYEQTLKQIWAVAKAIDDGNTELAVAEASTLVNMYKSKDPTWVVTATLIDSVYNRIYDTDSFSPEQKQAAMIALFHKNKEFIQRNQEKLREVLWDDYDTYAEYMNQMLYQWDWMVISNLESIQSSWKGSSWSTKAASTFSSALKDLASKIWWGSSSRWTWSTWSYKQRVPIVIKWADLVKDLWLNWYTPTGSSIKVTSHKPSVDLSIGKDINRNVKWPITQTISTKKQLSNIEAKTTKALEAES